MFAPNVLVVVRGYQPTRRRKCSDPVCCVRQASVEDGFSATDQTARPLPRSGVGDDRGCCPARDIRAGSSTHAHNSLAEVPGHCVAELALHVSAGAVDLEVVENDIRRSISLTRRRRARSSPEAVRTFSQWNGPTHGKLRLERSGGTIRIKTGRKVQ